MGRTKRKRKRKKLSNITKNQVSCESIYIELLKFMKKKKYRSSGLIPANFLDTGRGMMAKKTFQREDTLISLPCELLIGVKKALKASKWAQVLLLTSKNPRFTSLQILCTFLMEGRDKVVNGINFEWDVYVKTLPESFDFHHIFWDASSINLLPKTFQEKVKLMHEKVRSDYEAVKSALDFLPGQEKLAISWSVYRWAWCCVNTRCIYSNHEKLRLENIINSPSDNYYLAPFLDLFNHSFSAKVSGFFNETSQAYEIKTLKKVKKFEQVFIVYGSHSSKDLFLEYGFIIPGQNPNDIISVSLDNILSTTTMLEKLCVSCRKSINCFLISQFIDEGWTFSYSGLSYNLVCTLLVISKLCLSVDKADYCKPFNNCSISWILQQENSLLRFIRDVQNEIISTDILKFANTIRTNLIDHLKAKFYEGYEKIFDKEFDEQYQMVSDLYKITLNIFDAAMLHNIEESFDNLVVD